MSNIEHRGNIKMKDNKYDLEERLIDFAIIISDIVDNLPITRLGIILADNW